MREHYVTVRCRVDGKRLDVKVAVDFNPIAAAKRLAIKAAGNKSRVSTACHGAVRVVVLEMQEVWS